MWVWILNVERKWQRLQQTQLLSSSNMFSYKKTHFRRMIPYPGVELKAHWTFLRLTRTWTLVQVGPSLIVFVGAVHGSDPSRHYQDSPVAPQAVSPPQGHPESELMVRLWVWNMWRKSASTPSLFSLPQLTTTAKFSGKKWKCVEENEEEIHFTFLKIICMTSRFSHHIFHL